MLYATKGIDPNTLWDNQTAEHLRVVIRHGIMDAATKAFVRECKKALLGKAPTYESEHVERIIHGVRVSDEQAYAFMQVHAAIADGEVLTAGVHLDCVPGSNTQENFRTLRKVCADSGLPVEIEASTQPSMFGPFLKVRTDLRVQKTTMCDHIDTCDGQHGPVAINHLRVKRPIFELDLGHTSATRTWGFLKTGVNVARWMDGSPYLHFLLPTEEYERHFRRAE
jgi:hypothetical protein